MRLAGQHALVTGANRGIGAAIARHLADEGADLTLMVRDPARAAPVAADLRGLGVRVAVVAADITDGDAVRRGCAAGAAELGPVTILINNAGTAASQPFLKSDVALFERLIAMHLLGPVQAAQSVLPAMVERGFGRIVNVASIAGLVGAPYIAAYASAKHAMVGLTRALAAEFRSKGILVNAVCPGYTDTELVSNGVAMIVARTGRSPEEALRTMLESANQSRLVTIDEVARAVVAYSTPTTTASGEARPLLGDDATPTGA
jgi:NAD(P)-dependent dehydrogenase (short-subunit alcohol dehydrogenase family)